MQYSTFKVQSSLNFMSHLEILCDGIEKYMNIIYTKSGFLEMLLMGITVTDQVIHGTLTMSLGRNSASTSRGSKVSKCGWGEFEHRTCICAQPSGKDRRCPYVTMCLGSDLVSGSGLQNPNPCWDRGLRITVRIAVTALYTCMYVRVRTYV